MRLGDLAKAVSGSILYGNTNTDITSLCVDSRQVKPGALFFCVPGLRINAHDFAPQAVASGAAALVVDHQLDLDCPQVLVSDVREALSYMAAEFYGRPADSLHLIGITGTKGKTTSSFLVKSILEAAGLKTGLIGTVCSMIGSTQLPSRLTTPDPLDFQKLLREMADAGVTHVVMEVSAHSMVLKRLQGITFDAAAFINFSQDHLDMFGTMDAYFAAKMLLFQNDFCKKAFYNVDDERVATAMRKDPATVSYGIRGAADIYANDIEISESGCEFLLSFHKRFRLPIKLHLPGLFNVYNCLTAAALCDHVGVPAEAIRRGLENMRNVPGRIELLDTDTPYRVILDYAHTPDSLENILITVRQTARARVIALFGCGGDRDQEKRPIMGEISGRLADFTILTSDNPRSENPYDILMQIEGGIKTTRGDYTVIENRREAIRYALRMARPGDVVVLAGKGHETYQEIKGVKHPFNEKTIVKEILETF